MGEQMIGNSIPQLTLYSPSFRTPPKMGKSNAAFFVAIILVVAGIQVKHNDFNYSIIYQSLLLGVNWWSN